MPCVALAASLALPACADEHSDEEAQLSDEWNRAYDERSNGKEDNLSCSGFVVPDTGNFGKRVALTFDDGPNPNTTPQVLDILAAHDVAATFFINGSRVTGPAHRAVLQRILDEGHVLANHSQHHKNLKNLSIDAVEQEVMATDAVIRAAGAEPRYFRFPFGSSSCATASLVRARNYIVSGWHVDSGDWCYASSTGGVGYCSASTFAHVPDSYRGDMQGYTLSQIHSRAGGIVLFHDIHQNTVNNLADIIEVLEDANYSFTKMNDEATFPLLHGVELPFIGDVCSSHGDCADGAADQCLSYRIGDGSDAGFCSQSCEGTCPDRPGKASTFCTSLDGGVRGQCVSKAGSANSYCADVPGTAQRAADRFIGSSGVSAASATVCIP
jgi:peptidoglycan/xylan/chitin deacetylase (PgdA/CDA1 family)